MPTFEKGETSSLLKFVPFATFIHPSFWIKLSHLKLHKWKLSEEPVSIIGECPPTSPISDSLPCLVNINEDSFTKKSIPPDSLELNGFLICKNSLDSFLNLSKEDLLIFYANKIKESVLNATWLDKGCNSLLTFLLICFADLKRHKFYYNIAYPTLCLPASDFSLEVSCNLCQYLQNSFPEIESLNNSFLNFVNDKNQGTHFYFIMKKEEEEYTFFPLDKLSLPAQNEDLTSTFFVFRNTSSIGDFPSWPLRNFLFSITHVIPNSQKVKILSLKLSETGSVLPSYSFVFTFWLRAASESDRLLNSNTIIGWDKTNLIDDSKYKFADISSLLDPLEKFNSVKSLNISLMKWRNIRDLNISAFTKSRCLLIGAGTLGCNIARGLLSWGIEDIAFIDSAHVSASNILRQSLFTFQDVLNPLPILKSECAATNLKKINPTLNVSSHSFAIPMLGHQYSNEAELRETLQKLIRIMSSDCDVIFLLTDSRESRWLPTLLACAHQKIAITAALGFDSFVVIRHGVYSFEKNGKDPSPRLGCYFCHDISVPTNSTRDRSIDQECTVSRSALSQMASGYAVELFASLAQRDPTDNVNSIFTTCLGKVPHQIRVFLSDFSIMTPQTHSFSKCSACCEVMIQRYLSEGVDFLMQIFTAPSPVSFVEEVCGLDTYFKSIDELSSDILTFDCASSSSSDQINEPEKSDDIY